MNHSHTIDTAPHHASHRPTPHPATYSAAPRKAAALLLPHLIRFMLLATPSLLPFPTLAHGKARHHVIIDTDCAADDQRALCLLLGNNEVEVLAITTSEGALTPRRGAHRVKEMLDELHHEGIPIGEGRPLSSSTPRWRDHSEQIVWSLSPTPASTPQSDMFSFGRAFESAAELITEVANDEEERVVFVALGPLTNLADALNANPHLGEQVEYVVWYNDAAAPTEGENFRSDPAAAREVLGSGLRVTMVSADDRRPLAVTEALLDTMAAVATPHTLLPFHSHTRLPLSALIEEQHLQLWDDLAVLALLHPELFRSAPVAMPASWHSSDPADTTASPSRITLMVPHDTLSVTTVNGALARIMRGRPETASIVFLGFPAEMQLYAEDVRPLIESAARRHGAEEWRASVLTNELHGHLGLYATIGVKMGMRAREYFNIGVDDIRVLSYAGHTPPMSCLNDGLQVATGATLGHGLIEVTAPATRKNGPEPRPEARFTFKGRNILIKLKPRIAERIKRDVERGAERYGDTGEYWQYIRRLALRYWAELDRHEIFDIYPEGSTRY